MPAVATNAAPGLAPSARHVPDIDGLWHQSSMTGVDAVTLFTYAADSFPERPMLSVPLDHPGLRGHLLAAAEQIGYRVV